MSTCSITKIGPFEILELVGRGAMGAVYRAVDPMIGRMVAIKVIRSIGSGAAEDSAFLKERLFREAQAAGSLSHPGIVTVYQVGAHENEAYVAMEYIDGPTLERHLAVGKPLDPSLVARVLLDVAAALDYAHQRGVIHRDIKPANIMLASAPGGRLGAVKITDFGIAKSVLGATLTQTGMVLGTPFYMSPEQVQGMPLDGRSDQFALAVVAYQMLSGRKPFVGETITSVCYQIVHAEPPSLAEMNSSLPPAVFATLQRALQKDPSKRFSTCSEFAAALVDACAPGLHRLAPEPRTSQPVEPPPPVALPPRKLRLPRIAPFAALACLALVLLCAWLLPAINAGGAPPATPAAASTQPQIPARSASNGRLIWTGRATRGTLLRFENGRASTGQLSGALPGEPIEINILPADRSGRRLTVFTTDERYATPERVNTSAGLALFSWDPRHIMDLTLWESPGPSNNWNRLVLRVNTARVTACIIEWTRKSPQE